ncbi:MAG: CoB--CoM heterodisulfide reductase iron-sulfur subunit B family protein [Deltaproteobacteria bacterium]|nr:CoB--CoM heterodisulfide reductase iron-sulfur subunit B family protein [Deltaproteobacteria bacterium]
MDIAYYPGCSLKASSALYDVQSRRVFEGLGIYLKEIPDWNCCGATSAGKVDDFLAMAMPARNLGIAEATGLAEMVIPCSACYSRTLVAQNRLEKDPVLKDTINAELSRKVGGGIKVSSILEVLLTAVASGDVAKSIRVDKKTLKGFKPACYYGCLQTRFPEAVPVPDDVENPQGMEKVLKALGIQALDWSYKTDCCGASAAVMDADASDALMARIMKDAVARGANCFVVTCPMCQLNLDAYQDRLGLKHGIRERLPVYFITEILGLAMGMGVEELQIDRHLTDATTLLKELELI